MNPFDFTGPDFLIFYVALCAVVIVGSVILRRKIESAPTPRIDLSDPLLIAYLRGGDAETMRVAAVSLVDRGLLTCSGTRLKAATNARSESVRRPVEKELLRKFASGEEAASMFDDSKLKSACKEYEQTLKKVGLLPDDYITRVRAVVFGIVALLLGGIGVAKLIIALERGRPNVCFLVILIIASIVIASRQLFPRLTESGQAMLESVKQLYSELRDRATFLQPGGATIEPMMLAAVFGVGALAGEGFAYTKKLFPRAKQVSGSSSSGSSCGSGCGFSGGSSSSCGSSCGGGCGGGCGGCGS